MLSMFDGNTRCDHYLRAGAVTWIQRLNTSYLVTGGNSTDIDPASFGAPVTGLSGK
jgi:hypothetical protein